MTTPQDIANKMADVLRLDVQRATVQGPSPNIGYAYVVIESDGGVALQREVRTGYVTTMMQAGTAVFIGLDKDRELSIVGIDFRGQLEVGLNPAANNAADRYFYGSTNQDEIQTLQCHPLSNDSMKVVVRPWFYVRDGLWYEKREQQIDLTSYIPIAGNHVLIGVWIKADNTAEVTTATEQSILDKLDITDVQECENATSEHSSPVEFWRLYGGMTGVKEEDAWRDSRQIVNINESLTVEEESEGVVIRHVHKLIFTDGSLVDLGSGEVFVDPVGSGSGDYASDAYAFHTNISGEIHALTEKTTPVVADELVIEDSADSFSKKKVTISNLANALGSVDDTALYIGLGA